MIYVLVARHSYENTALIYILNSSPDHKPLPDVTTGVSVMVGC